MAPKEGGTAVKLATVSNGELVGAVVSDGVKVYFAGERANLGTNQEELATVPIGGGPITKLGSIGLPSAQLRYDAAGQRLYGTTAGTRTRDSVYSYSISDKSLVRLAENQTVRGGVAQDAQYVYWLTEFSVVRLIK